MIYPTGVVYRVYAPFAFFPIDVAAARERRRNRWRDPWLAVVYGAENWL